MAYQQESTQMNDELAALFSRNLTFNPEVQQAPPAPEPVHHSEPAPSAPITYSISQHYHHSAHIPKPQPAQEEQQRRASEPAQTITSESILRSHGIDPQSLTPSQLQLFRVADDQQKLRLLELWSICPPNGGGDIPALAWSSTTLEQEESLARVRYERQQQQQQQQPNLSFDGTPVQAQDGRWQHESEPYMMSGYEEIMRREQERERQAYEHTPRSYNKATDPVYLGTDYARQQQEMSMAMQYGAFEQFRGDAMDVM